MKYVIRSIPQAAQRYATLGDYWTEADGTRTIVVSEMGDWRYDFLIAIHEMIEFALCSHNGIPEPVISRFDKIHPELDDPGADPRAPYHHEHMLADAIERILARELGVNWKTYDARCDAVAATHPKP